MNPSGLFVVKKAGRFLKGHSYATGVGDRYHWTPNAGVAAWMKEDRAHCMANSTGGKVVGLDKAMEEQP